MNKPQHAGPCLFVHYSRLLQVRQHGCVWVHGRQGDVLQMQVAGHAHKHRTRIHKPPRACCGTHSCLESHAHTHLPSWLVRRRVGLLQSLCQPPTHQQRWCRSQASQAAVACARPQACCRSLPGAISHVQRACPASQNGWTTAGGLLRRYSRTQGRMLLGVWVFRVAWRRLVVAERVSTCWLCVCGAGWFCELLLRCTGSVLGL